MGTMASPTVLSAVHGSNGKIVTLSVTGSASYATGGDTFDLSTATVGIDGGFAIVNDISGGSDGGVYGVRFDRAASGAPATTKLVIYNSGAADAGDETANATDLSQVTFLLTVFGR